MQSQPVFQKMAIISRLFGSDPRLASFLFEAAEPTRLRDRPAVLLEDAWELESEERILIRAALDLLNGTGHAFLSDLLTGLGERNFDRLIFALLAYRGLKQQRTSFSPNQRRPHGNTHLEQASQTI